MPTLKSCVFLSLVACCVAFRPISVHIRPNQHRQHHTTSASLSYKSQSPSLLRQMIPLSTAAISTIDTRNGTYSAFPTVSNYDLELPTSTNEILPTPTAPTTTSTSNSNPVTLIGSTEELLKLMDGSADDRILVIKYYANYCKICQRAGIQYKKVAAEYPNVRFAKIEQGVLKTPAADTLRSLGVSKFPFVQMYRNGRCVASFSTGPSHLFVKRVRDTVDLCLDRTPQVWSDFAAQFAQEIESNQEARRKLLSTSSPSAALP